MGFHNWHTTKPAWVKLKPVTRSLRREATPAESLLWERLRDRRLGGLKFRRQHSIDRYVADFYCADAKLAVEVDGGIHEEQIAEDGYRAQVMATQGVRTLRVTNEQVIGEIDAVLRRILEHARAEA
jgi:very-short-patch-repair endonuclease